MSEEVMFTNVLTAQLMPLHDSLKAIHESISCLTNVVRKMESLPGTAAVNDRGQGTRIDARTEDLECFLTNRPSLSPNLRGRQGADAGRQDSCSTNGASVTRKDFGAEESIQCGQLSSRSSQSRRGLTLDAFTWGASKAAHSRGGSLTLHDIAREGSLKRGQVMMQNMADTLKGIFEEPVRQGRLHKFVHSRGFRTCTSLVICINAIFMAYTSDWEMQNIDRSTPQSFDVLEHIFIAFYTIELALRFLDHRCYFFCCEEAAWNVLDFALVLISLVDTLLMALRIDERGGGNITLVRTLRLLKVAKILRTFRVMQVFRELAQILESFLNCIISLFWSLVMMILVIWLFALFFLQGLSGYMKDHDVSESEADAIRKDFGSLLRAMSSLYMAVTGGNDWAFYLNIVARAGIPYEILFFLFTFVFVFALLNILTGIFVEKAVVAAQPDREEMIAEQCRKRIQDAAEFHHLCCVLDADHTGTISRDEFMSSMRSELMRSYMAAKGIEVRDVDLFFDIVGASDADEVSIERFVQGCMNIKGMATNFDMQKLLVHVDGLRRHTRRDLHQMKEVLADLTRRLDRGDATHVRRHAMEDPPTSPGRAGLNSACARLSQTPDSPSAFSYLSEPPGADDTAPLVASSKHAYPEAEGAESSPDKEKMDTCVAL